MAEARRILIVDDDEGQRALLSDMVEDLGHRPVAAADGFEALAQLKLGFDLVLLDASMPGLDGFEVTQKIRQNGKHKAVPIIIVTALHSDEDRRRAMEAGADDFIAKPVKQIELHPRMNSLLRRKAAEDALEAERDELQLQMQRQTADLRRSVEELTQAQRTSYRAQLETLERLAIASEYRDEGTGSHVRRMGQCCALLGQRMNLPPAEVELLRYAAPMHDVGKIGIPDGILLKKGKLDEHQWEIMKKHCSIGARILAGSSSKYLQAGEVIALTHHEKWDGTGYPEGLEGEEIPIYGRITAVADVFDALTSDRPYRKALSPGQALEVINKGKGKHFDPQLVSLFLGDLDEILALRKQTSNQRDTS